MLEAANAVDLVLNCLQVGARLGTQARNQSGSFGQTPGLVDCLNSEVCVLRVPIQSRNLPYIHTQRICPLECMQNNILWLASSLINHTVARIKIHQPTLNRVDVTSVDSR